MRLHGVAAVAFVVAVVAALIAGWTMLSMGHVPRRAGALAQNPVITPGQASTVVRNLWSQREAALTNDSSEALAAVDTASALAADLSVTTEARDGGRWSQRVRRPLGEVALFVPSQSHFPASFLAAVQSTAQYSDARWHMRPEGHDVVLLVLTEESPMSTWHVALETSYHGRLDRTDVGLDLASLGEQGGYDGSPPQPGWIRPSTIIAQLASFYQHYAEFGEAPSESPFQASYWTTGQGERLSAYGLNGQPNSKRFRDHLDYSTDAADAVYEFDVGSMNVTCGTVRGHETATPDAPGGYLYQTPDRLNWGTPLPPGGYSRITIDFLHQVCLAIPPGSFGRVLAISGDSEAANLSVTGTPVTQGPLASPGSQLQ
jgi:hypothetical protein